MSRIEEAEKTTRTVIAGAVGNVLEWYDFALFGFFAPIIGTVFFPSSDRLASLLATFGVFALGFLMRPLGGVIFGHIGDRVGRKKALELSVLLMAVPTTLVGVLPGYDQIGISAAIALTLVRMLQGMSVGGELIGSISFLGESAAEGRRGLLGSWTTFGANVGVLLGSGVAALLGAVLTHEQLTTWGWRIPFLGGILAGVAGLWIRRGVAESPCFAEASGSGDVSRFPIEDALRHDLGGIVGTTGLALLMAVGFYLPFVWLSTWLSHIRRPPFADALTVNTIAMTALLVQLPLGGWLSDLLGRKRVLVAGALGYAVLSYPLFLLLQRGTFATVLCAQLAFAACAGLFMGACPAAFVELFPTRTRYSGIGLGYNLAQALFGGTAPLVATWLIRATGHTMAPAYYLTAIAVFGAVFALGIPDRSRQPLR